MDKRKQKVEQAIREKKIIDDSSFATFQMIEDLKEEVDEKLANFQKEQSPEAQIEKVAIKLATKLATLEKGDKGDTPSEEELTPLIKALIPDFIPEPKNGEDYILTDQDKQEIASLVEVPIVEKEIETILKTEVIRETPIVTENVVEKAMYEEPNQIVAKVNQATDLIDNNKIKGFSDLERISKMNAFNPAMGPSFADLVKKQDKLIAGTNITILGNTISSTGGGGTVGPGTINQIAYFDSTTTVNSLDVATYPSLTELSYVKGVTSSIQTQLNTKGTGTVMSVSVVTANGVSGSVANPTTTPAITFTLGAITPTSTNGVLAATMAFLDATSSVQTQLNGKQATLVSATNIKTINGTTLLGAGDLATPQGTVTAIGVTTANGVSGTSSGGATPNLTITLGVITPTSVNGLTLHAGTDGWDITGGTTPRKATFTGADMTFTGSGAIVTTFLAETNTIAGVVGRDRKTGQTAAVNLATYTVGASDSSYMISANVLVTTSTVHAFTVTCSYTSEDNVARVVTLQFSNLAGTLVTSIANAAGAVPYEGVLLHIRAKAATTIIIGSAAGGTYTTVTYSLEERILLLQ